jgi:hypothetical protein
LCYFVSRSLKYSPLHTQSVLPMRLQECLLVYRTLQQTLHCIHPHSAVVMSYCAQYVSRQRLPFTLDGPEMKTLLFHASICLLLPN